MLRPFYPAAWLLVVCLLAVGAIPSTAHAQDDFSRYLKAAERLYKSLEYERALEQVQRAKKLARTLDQDVAVALHEGIILADLGKREESLVAFKTALLLDPEAKLPFKVSPKMAKDVEEIRARVRKELVDSPGPGQDAAPQAQAPSSPPQAGMPAAGAASAPPQPARTPETQELARREPAPPPPPVSPSQPAPSPASQPSRSSPLDRATLLKRAADYEARLRQQGDAAATSAAMTQLKEIREQAARAATSGQRMDVVVRLDKWERQFLAKETAAVKAEPQASPAAEPAPVSTPTEPAPAPAPANKPSRPSAIDRATLLKRASDYEAQLRERGDAADSGQAMIELKEIREQATRAATSGQRMDVAVRLDKWERRFLPPQLTAADVMAVVLAHKPAVAECVKKQREQQPGSSGRLEMRWSVQPSGAAKDVTCLSGELCSTYLAGCLTGLIQGWTFPAREGGLKTFEFPFAF
jgi:tetratricopeptide (TPR) repeat protein